jgi:hypothetical protein
MELKFKQINVLNLGADGGYSDLKIFGLSVDGDIYIGEETLQTVSRGDRNKYFQFAKIDTSSVESDIKKLKDETEEEKIKREEFQSNYFRLQQEESFKEILKKLND